MLFLHFRADNVTFKLLLQQLCQTKSKPRVWMNFSWHEVKIFRHIVRGKNSRKTLYTFCLLSEVELRILRSYAFWAVSRSSRYGHSSWFLRHELQTARDSSHSAGWMSNSCSAETTDLWSFEIISYNWDVATGRSPNNWKDKEW